MLYFRLLFCAMVLLLSGCATGSGEDPAQYNFLISEQTPFLVQGPGQSVPDKYLSAGTRVRILLPGGDYTRIETVGGESGWVKSGVLEKNE
jgi:hypothetical protein